MALTESTMVPLGTACPDFTLPGVDGRLWSLHDFHTPALLVVVMCNHCPYVQAIDDRLNELAKIHAGQCAVVGINSNDAVAYPDDSFEAMRARAAEKGYVFPYLWDEEQTVARALGAVCTPDFFLYDSHRRLRYRGRMDDNWKDAAHVTRHDLRRAIVRVLNGEELPTTQLPSMGCSIKWKAGV
ncbi:thioredoxin family protein [Geothrix limicola]|uniref:Thioredoxin family protein n=1 Tax=Geothrix limicola TaxID=2927978 RepID=A0ABQ5QE27_9BACT|nr:thioredoxin family protein [Geothrix limicola]GLH73104.1 thioredoxin family protein [Geothrix limicola]